MSKGSFKQVIYPDTTTSSNIQPISKGGTGAIVRSEALVNLGAIDIAQLGEAGGVAKADANKKVAGSLLPPGSVDQDTVSIQGPSSVLVGSDVTYAITDYDRNKTYNIAVAGGTWSRETDKILIKTSGTPGTLKIVINGIEHSIDNALPVVIVARPSLTSPLDGTTNISVTPTLTATTFAVESGSDTHAMTDWEIRTSSSGLGSVVWESRNDAVNKTTVTVSELDNLATYYVRCRYKAAGGVWSEWSPDVRFTTTALQTAGVGPWTSAASSTDGIRLIVAKHNGFIYTSDTSGSTWQERSNAGVRRWMAVASSGDGLKLTAAEYNGYIYTSTDGGATWTERTSAGVREWYDLASSANGLLLTAVARNGYIYTSVDGGESWLPSIGAMEQKWQTIASSTDGLTLLAAVDGGYIYTSTDGGANWVVRTGAGSRAWRAVAMSSTGSRLVAAAANDHIYISNDGGVSWSQTIVKSAQEWQAVTCSGNGTRITAVVKNGYTYSALDGGIVWTEQAGPAKYWYDAATSANGIKLVAVVNGGYVYTSTDGGVTWVSR